MLRTLRAFLLVAPLAFVFVLVSFLASHPQAPETFSPYPFLSDALGPGAAKHPVLRFATTSTVFFLPPYLAVGLLLLLSEVGVGSAAAVWAGRKRGRKTASFSEPPESRVAFVVVTLGAAVACGVSLHRVAHGGELPGGVNVAPLFVVAATFASMAAGLAAALLVSIPRALVRRAG